jgi:hypothetical protein
LKGRLRSARWSDLSKKIEILRAAAARENDT